jgi:antitoxin component of MazEF toxin-antitoxin module
MRKPGQRGGPTTDSGPAGESAGPAMGGVSEATPGENYLPKRLVKHSFTRMIKTVSKIGNSNGIIFDAGLMDLAHLKVGDKLNLEVHVGGAITLTPIKPRPSRQEVSRVIKSTMKDYAGTMKKLA